MSDTVVDIDKFSDELLNIFSAAVERCPHLLRLAMADAVDIVFAHIAQASDSAYVTEYPPRLQEFRHDLLSGLLGCFVGDLDVQHIKGKFYELSKVRADRCVDKGYPDLAFAYGQAAGKLTQLFADEKGEVLKRAGD